jgi:hypothetical protein
LKQEIAARQFFVLCDSPNARASKWVQEEVAMIQGMEGKDFRKIDLSKELETEIHNKLVELSKRATVFLSYARQDQEIAERIRRALLRHDYRVWLDAASLGANESVSALQSAIDEAVARGFVLVLLSPASLKKSVGQTRNRICAPACGAIAAEQRHSSRRRPFRPRCLAASTRQHSVVRPHDRAVR